MGRLSEAVTENISNRPLSLFFGQNTVVDIVVNAMDFLVHIGGDISLLGRGRRDAWD